MKFAGSWRTTRALDSFRQLVEIIDEMSEEEVFYCLQLEAATQRRKTVVDRLINRAADLNRQKFINSLKEKFNGTSEVRHPVEG